jgi:hypothetical protein
MTKTDGAHDASLLAAFIKCHSHDATRQERENAAWASDVVDELVKSAPEDAWRFFISVVQEDADRGSLPMLAAGAFEDFMSLHGEAFIERVETMSRRDPAFRWMLGGVWQGGMSGELWQRFQKIPGRPKW